VRADPNITAVSPALGGSCTSSRRRAPPSAGTPYATAFALGVESDVQGDYEVVTGADPARPDQLVASAQFLRAAGARVGDTVEVAAGFDPQLRQYSGRRRSRWSAPRASSTPRPTRP
jgi:hypothetical protein